MPYSFDLGFILLAKVSGSRSDLLLCTASGSGHIQVWVFSNAIYEEMSPFCSLFLSFSGCLNDLCLFVTYVAAGKTENAICCIR